MKQRVYLVLQLGDVDTVTIYVISETLYYRLAPLIGDEREFWEVLNHEEDSRTENILFHFHTQTHCNDTWPLQFDNLKIMGTLTMLHI